MFGSLLEVSMQIIYSNAQNVEKRGFCPDRSSSPWFSQLVLELTASFQLSSLPDVQPAAQPTHVRRTYAEYAETREEMTEKRSQQKRVLAALELLQNGESALRMKDTQKRPS